MQGPCARCCARANRNVDTTAGRSYACSDDQMAPIVTAVLPAWARGLPRALIPVPERLPPIPDGMRVSRDLWWRAWTAKRLLCDDRWTKAEVAVHFSITRERLRQLIRLTDASDPLGDDPRA